MIALVHLVWGPLGAAQLRSFLSAYRAHPPGAEHDLVVLFNAVGAGEREAFDAELAGIEHTPLVLGRPVQDLTAYARAAERLSHDRLCFLNSYSRPLAPAWLAKLDEALDLAGAGLVGATGSWASFQSAVRNSLHLPNPYRGVPQPAGSLARELWCEIERELEQTMDGAAEPEVTGSTPGPRAHRALNRLKSLRRLPEHLLHFEGPPAYHLRTNAFLLDRSVYASLRTRPIARKMDALRIESGRDSYTRQILDRGMRALVVALDGTTYEHLDWPSSSTFWQGDQEGLLIADNRTSVYANGPAAAPPAGGARLGTAR